MYGLPERYRDRIAGARVVANPGCYPEAALLALLPLAGAVEEVVIDAKARGGAGRCRPRRCAPFSRAADNVSPYKVYARTARDRAGARPARDLRRISCRWTAASGHLLRACATAPPATTTCATSPPTMPITPSWRSWRPRRACAP